MLSLEKDEAHSLPSKVSRQGLLLARERNLFLFVHFVLKSFQQTPFLYEFNEIVKRRCLLSANLRDPSWLGRFCSDCPGSLLAAQRPPLRSSWFSTGLAMHFAQSSASLGSVLKEQLFPSSSTEEKDSKGGQVTGRWRETALVSCLSFLFFGHKHHQAECILQLVHSEIPLSSQFSNSSQLHQST